MINRWYRLGRKVAVIRFDPQRNKDYFDVGKIVAFKRYETMTAEYQKYAVQFGDDKIELFAPDELFFKWKKELAK